jgi:hypothetical protein
MRAVEQQQAREQADGRAAVQGAQAQAKTHSLRAAFVVLLALKLGALYPSNSDGGGGGGGGGWSWWLVFSPLWAVFALQLAADAAALPAKGPPAACHACCGVGLVLAAALLACAKLAGAAFSSCWVFFPVFLVGACAQACVTCVVCCAVDTDGLAQEENGAAPGGARTTESQSTAPQRTQPKEPALDARLPDPSPRTREGFSPLRPPTPEQAAGAGARARSLQPTNGSMTADDSAPVLLLNDID